MRIVMLLPLALAAVAAGGCRTASEGTEQAALGVPQASLDSFSPEFREGIPGRCRGTGRRSASRPRRFRTS